MEKVAILNFGDSQGEIWDYVFCNNDNYIKYKDNKNIGWRSGWSTRGLKKIEHQNRLFGEIPKLYKKYKNMVILLTFGSTDIEWNLSYKRFINNEFPDTEIFINEMKNTLINTIDTYLEIEKNFETIYDYTSKGNIVAVISNGTAVLGLGNIGAAASKPVMDHLFSLYTFTN